MWGRLAWGGLLLGYAVLLGIISITDWQSSPFNDADGRNASGYNPLLEPGKYLSPPKATFLLPSYTHLALAEQAAMDGKVDAAKRHALDALSSNLANGKAALVLFHIYTRPALLRVDFDETDDTSTEDSPMEDNANAWDKFIPLSPQSQQAADKLASINFKLRPTYEESLVALAEYWWHRGQQEKALRAWADALIHDAGLAEIAFPLFHTALDTPPTRIAFQQYMQQPPVWWVNFFRYLLQHETNADKLRQYYQARTQSPFPPKPDERESYIHYLIQNKRWLDAYQVWEQSMPDTQTNLSHLLFDGSFEDTDNLNYYFTWNIGIAKETKIRQDSTSGTRGKRSLRIAFKKGDSILFQHVSQKRMLAEGNYHLQGRYRPKQLKTSKGLRWRVHCIDSDVPTFVAESETFKGHQRDWKTFQFDFSIPTGCGLQLIRLESDSPYAHHNLFEGELWFDDLAIEPGTTQPNTPPKQ